MRLPALPAWACLALIVPTPALLAEDRPIPQDPARQARAALERLEGNRRTLAGAYDRVGKKDPKWDRPAREALEAAALSFSHAADPGAGPEDVFGPARRAVDAGCDDPLILFLLADSSRPPNVPDPAELERRRLAAAAAMERGDYPPLRKALALAGAGMIRARKAPATPEDRKEAARLFAAALALAPRDVAKEAKRAEVEGDWFDLVKGLIAGYRAIGLDQKTAHEKVDAALSPAASLKAFRLQIKAASLIDEAWEARGHGMAGSVTEKGGRTFEACLGESYKALIQAWSADPKGYRTPTLMLRIMTGLGGERAEMEAWFRRAMELKGDNAVACAEKMNYLDPKWYGSREELMAFRQACRATGNWRGGLTLVAADAHVRWSMQLDQAEMIEYLHSPEVWGEVKAIYDEYLGHYPRDDAARSVYAGIAYRGSHHAEAEKEFNALGDRLVGSRAFPLEDARKYQDFFARMARLQKEEAALKAAEKKGAAAPR